MKRFALIAALAALAVPAYAAPADELLGTWECRAPGGSPDNDAANRMVRRRAGRRHRSSGQPSIWTALRARYPGSPSSRRTPTGGGKCSRKTASPSLSSRSPQWGNALRRP